MSATDPRVVIAGGGLAGPCLAHGLRRAGFEVSLHERDPLPASRGQGYRIHVAQEGDAALLACLPPELYELAHATSGKPGTGVTILSGQLDVLHRVTFDRQTAEANPAAGVPLSIDRLTLRQVLLAGLEGAVHFGAALDRYELRPDGGVRALFADGSHADADLLVAADGAGSRVRAQLLPGARVVETGQWAIFGKTPLTDEVRRVVPPASLDGFSTVVGSDGRFLPLAGLEYRTAPNAAAARLCPGLTFVDPRDYVMWVLGAPQAAFGVPAERFFGLDGDALRDLAADRIADWHRDVVEVVRRSDPATVHRTSIRTSLPVEPWESGPVTLIGDAIHCMIPAGIGAAVALRDAGLLARRLAEARAAGTPFVDAVRAYEAEMLQYGFEAVAAAQRVGQQLTA